MLGGTEMQDAPALQSPVPVQLVAQAGAGWSAALVHWTAAYSPQSCACPAQAVSSGTSVLPQTNAVQVASRRVPWQSVAALRIVQADACRKVSGQSAGALQHAPPEQQMPFWQNADAHAPDALQVSPSASFGTQTFALQYSVAAAQRDESKSSHVVLHACSAESQVSPLPHWLAVAQQVAPSAPQQRPFSHFSPGSQVPCASPWHASPSLAWGTQAPPTQVLAALQSDAAVQLAAHAAAGWSASPLQSTEAYRPQSRTAPVQALSSPTVTVPHALAVQVASRRVPWHVVVAPASPQDAASR